MKKKNNIADFSESFFTAGMSDSEKEQLMNQLKEDLKMQEELERTGNAWNKFDSAPDRKYRNTENAWKNLNERLNQDGLLEESGHSARSAGYFLLRIAAAILILAAIGFSVSELISGRKSMHYETIAWQNGLSEKGVQLPDGSLVYLNEDSKITFPESFDSERTVQLTGEAYFDVEHDPSKPFKIHTGETIITVLGTSFNVKEVPDGKKVEVLVQSGRVKMQAFRNREGIILEKGQFGISEAGTERLSIQKNLNYLSWKTREFRFVNTDLDGIFETLEKSYHVKIDTGNLPLGSLRMTSTYKDQSFDTILQTICTAFNLSYDRDGNRYYLSER